MRNVAAPRFDLEFCNNDREREFIEFLHARAESGNWVADGWPRDDRIILTVCPSDSEYNCVLRTLRVDYNGLSVIYGPDETHQLVTDLDPMRPNVLVLSERPISELATVAADWLECEMRRSIVRHEWTRPEFTRRVWALGDTGEELVASGPLRPDLGPPDRIVPVSLPWC